MHTRGDSTDTPVGYSRRIIWLIVCLILPAWFVLVFELLGGSRYGRNPIHLGAWEPLIGLALALVFITPALIALGFVIAFWKRDALRIRRGLLSIAFLLLALSFLISVVSVLATFGGHPVWVDGYR
jgi:hypothetical protein